MQSRMAPTQSRLATPLSIQGVGNGSQSCVWKASIPIAVPGDDQQATLHTFEAPTVEGTGKDLPALLGLKSMKEKKAVLETSADGPYLTFPGPGGYKVEWSPGSLRIPLATAPSGHYVIPCDQFHLLSRKAGGVPDTHSALHAHLTADLGNAATSSSSSSSSSSSAANPQG